MSNKWTNSLARKSCILWLTYEELSQVIRASFISKLLGDLRTLQHAVPGIAIALTREEHQQAKELSIDWEEYQEESGCIMYTESARTLREKKGFTLACLAHSRPAAPTWRACQAWPARCCLVSATKLAAPVKKTGWGQNSKMKINMQTTCKICRALSTLSRGSLLALKLKSKYLWKRR